jgi:transcriptional antiterminator NusG
MEYQWYVLQVFSNYEKKVLTMLEDRSKVLGLEEQFADIVVPTEEIVEMKGGQKKTTERKFFPGYIFVNMNLNDETWHFVNSIPNVMGFVGGSSEKPAPISDREVMIILNKAEDAANAPRPKTTYQPGEVVRVIEGPFNDFNGVVEKVNYEKNKLFVAVQILGRATPVELNFNQVEKS